MKLQSNILFSNREEIKEAIKCGVIPRRVFRDVAVLNKWLVHVNNEGYCGGTNLELDLDVSMIADDILSAKHWADVRDEYMPKDLTYKEYKQILKDEDNTELETISISDDEGNEYIFEKPTGFNVKLYEVVNEIILGKLMYGTGVWSKKEGLLLNSSTTTINTYEEKDKYNLTPHKPKQEQYPILMFDTSYDQVYIAWDKNDKKPNDRYATQDEAMALVYKG